MVAMRSEEGRFVAGGLAGPDVTLSLLPVTERVFTILSETMSVAF
jgi:hypothetical protein